MQREAGGRAEKATALPAADRVAKIFSLKASIVAGANSPEGTDAADRFAIEIAALAREAPTQETRDVLDALLSTEELDRFVDGDGVPCRVSVVNALLALGFPYALEVSPPDLQLVRDHAPRQWRLKPIASAALFSMLWSIGWISAIVRYGTQTLHPVELQLGIPFLVGGGHGLAAMVGTLMKNPRKRLKLYSTLAWLGLLGPLASALVGVFLPPMFLIVGLFYATPAMIVAWLARKEAKKLSEAA